MFPWLWLWAPQVHFPLSGSVSQKMDLFDQIPRWAGDGDIERKAFDIASYGRQLGVITEVLLSRATKDVITPDKAAEALKQLEQIHCDIEDLKTRNTNALTQSISDQLERLRLRDPKTYRELLDTFKSPT